MKKINLIFPHQLFEKNPLLDLEGVYCLVEEYLFFNQYNFHVQKLLFHRASMKYYEDYLIKKKKDVIYISQSDLESDIRNLIPFLKKNNYSHINYILTEDNYLERRISQVAEKHEISLNKIQTPMFLNSRSELGFFKESKKKFYHTSFYIEQRKRLNVLIDEKGSPVGGKWSYDAENRKKYPKNKIPPKLNKINTDVFFKEARAYILQHFKDNLGEIPDEPIYPHTHQTAKYWFKVFLKERFYDFGEFEDAIVDSEFFLNHSVISPLLNNGLLTPKYILNEILNLRDQYPINSVEGFIRQIIGWREFIRGVYISKGSIERTTNFFNFNRKIPSSFYDGTTGIDPVDNSIKKVIKCSYNHHIERLMILGNFMLLCEFDPNEIYKWFMEYYIDAYDWVMVPNVYGMSQFADGGLMSTKPYLSSSNYIKKMSNYSKGDWEKIWDGLYWRFIFKNKDIFKKNIRMVFVINLMNRMKAEKLRLHINIADNFLKNL